MFLLPPFIRRLFQKKPATDDDFRIYSSDQALVVIIRELAQKQGRSEEEVLTEFARAGQDSLFNHDTLMECWDSLTDREQEVLALVCLGHRNYEIAELLMVSHQTIKSHLQNIFYKFNLRSTKELRRALKDWQFQGWWDARHS
jgi:DNA-binding NarL/FixJ family response regulator